MLRFLPAAAIAVSLNGFWIYLAALDLVGAEPRSSVTAVWYALVGASCLGGAWIERETLLARLRQPARPTRWYLAAGAILATWFLLNVLVVSGVNSVTRIFAALLVLWTLPAAILAFSLSPASIKRSIVAFAVLGSAYAVIEWVAFLHHHGKEVRFTPIEALDPITAAQFPGLAALALLAAGTLPGKLDLLRWALLALLVAGVVVPGSRGPIVAIAAAALAVCILLRGRERAIAILVVAAGLALGYAASTQVGSSEYLSDALPGGSQNPALQQRGGHTAVNRVEPISTVNIRREWWSTAIREIPDAPIIGHGVGKFVDETPEAHRMGVAGVETYPHNSPIESMFSLGVLGAIPYAVYLISALAALLILVRRRRRRITTLLAVGLWIFAFVGANISGEIGADALLWAAGALAVGLYADSRAARR